MSKGLELGTTLHDFELPDENGETHRLSELQGNDVLVLMLGRGEHCPRERQHQRELLKLHEWAPVAFIQMVTILPNNPHDVYKMRISAGAHWTFLADEELELQQALDIEEYTALQPGSTVPHTVIPSPGLKIERVYVGYWFFGRPSSYRPWDELQEVFRETKVDFDPTLPAVRAAWERAQRSV